MKEEVEETHDGLGSRSSQEGVVDRVIQEKFSGRERTYRVNWKNQPVGQKEKRSQDSEYSQKPNGTVVFYVL